MSPSRPHGVPGSLDRYSAPQRLAERAGRRFHVMAKPAGSACNLDYSYCFYLSKQNLPGGPGGGHMDDDLLDRFVQDHIQSVTADEVVFFGKVLVNFCETLVAQHMGLPSQICIHSEVCGKGVALEHDGDVYSCDHYVYPEYRLGNVRERSLGEMVFDPAQVKFGYAKSEALRRTAASANFSAIAGVSVPRIVCCARRMASWASTICAPDSSGFLRMRCRKRGGSPRDCVHRAAGGTDA
jgi:sulfatase maturation enzyme AslB (radical SAM superfamily)